MRSLFLKLSKWIPKYARLPLILCLVLNMMVYYGGKLLENLLLVQHREYILALDALIPRCSPFVVIYALAYLFWVINYILIARESPENNRFIFGDMIAKVLTLGCFLILPSKISRAPIEVQNIFDWALDFIYSCDTPVNLLPSLHCLVSHFCWRGIWKAEGVPGWYKIFSLVLAVLIFASTLFTKQHGLLDLPSAVLIAETGIFLSKRLRLGERYAVRCRKRYSEE